uniref:Uncharacterized protein TCIL3000_7_1120 n=1 Tax=Trypanosoma congolense (strain IL3000) TaxID=1068625 RepID=G0UPJ8_TRYCI|nr:unnamed protein product [Trypanosoma congolense IL3000]
MRRDGMTYNEDVLISVTDHVFEVLDCNVVLATLSSVGLGLLWQQEPFACARQRSYLTYILVALAIRVQYKSYNLSALATAAVYMTRLKFGIGTGCPSEEVLALLPIINDALTCDSNAGRKGSCSLLKLGCFGEV